MDFANRITRLPRAYSPDRGAEARALFPDHDGATADLLEGAAGCSPYLRLLMEKESAWLTTALRDPEAALATEMDEQRATGGRGGGGGGPRGPPPPRRRAIRPRHSGGASGASRC
jgi:hypothetical protein